MEYTFTIAKGKKIQTHIIKVRNLNDYNEYSSIYRNITNKWFKRTILEMRSGLSKLDIIKQRLAPYKSKAIDITPTKRAKLQPDEAEFTLRGAL